MGQLCKLYDDGSEISQIYDTPFAIEATLQVTVQYLYLHTIQLAGYGKTEPGGSGPATSTPGGMHLQQLHPLHISSPPRMGVP